MVTLPSLPSLSPIEVRDTLVHGLHLKPVSSKPEAWYFVQDRGHPLLRLPKQPDPMSPTTLSVFLADIGVTRRQFLDALAKVCPTAAAPLSEQSPPAPSQEAT
jgi:hypothetical protein